MVRGYTTSMKYLLSLIIVILIAMPLAIPDLVQAQTGTGVQIPNPIKCKDVNCLVAQVIRYILGTIAIVATLMFIWGGFMMLTSAGNAERIKKAKETLAWAAIGIVVILLSWAIIRFVLGSLINTSNRPLPQTPITTTLGCCVSIGPGATVCQDQITSSSCQKPGDTFHSRQLCSTSVGCP